MAEEEEEEIYCLCRRPYNDGEFMIQCDVCKDWFHGSCVGVEEYQAGDIDSYHCPNCQPEHGPLTLKRRRNWHRHDYSEINDGKKAVQTGTVVFVNNLKKNKKLCGDDILLRLQGSQLTPEYLAQHGFNRPILVEQKAGLGIVVPSSDFKVADVEKYVGPLREVDVIDVNRQDDFTMKMREWTDYYEATDTRKKILNVISLEFSNTDLAKQVSPPAVVRQIDWIERHWPNNLPEDSSLSRPRVQKYCLMSVKDSYTDFHVDFGGTSVWYHIVRGEKVFYFIPPTEENLLKYEQWVMSSNQSEIFFGDLVPRCWRCVIKAGNTLFIPTGWIHAVLTPQDSLVFGGNYLHRYNIGLQLRVYEMELRLDTPLKFLHPCYEALTWFAAHDLLKEIRDMHYRGTMPSNYLLEGLKEMAFVLGSWTRTKEKLKQHHKEIPPSVSHGELIEQISRTVAKLETLSQQETERRGRQETQRGREKPAMFDSPQKTPTKQGERRKSITMKLSTSTSQVLTHKEDNQKISMKLSVPQTVVVSTSLEEDSGSDISVGQEGSSQPIPPPPLAQKLSGRGFEGDAVVLSSGNRGVRTRVKAEPVGNHGNVEEEEEGRDYEEGDFIYPSLAGDLGLLSNTSPAKGHKRKSDDDDDLWMPQGPVKLVKGSIASSSRQKRNARKRSFEHSMSATSTKMTKMEEERADGTTSSALHLKPALVPGAKATDPVLGGGSLRVGGGEQGATEGGVVPTNPQRSRAAAAASAVNAALAASKPKSKPLTAKQRLGKIMGLGRGGRWK